MTAPGLLTDRYELTMLSSFLAAGSAGRRAVFEVFARRLPSGRRYAVFAGLGRLLDHIERFRFDAGEIAWLRDAGAITEQCAHYLADFRFTGDVDAYREGEIWFGGSPLVTVQGPLGECIVLETLILSVLNHDCAIAAAAARMVTAARGRPLIEMGGRRTHEEAAVAAARAAYLCGFAATSNLAAGRAYAIPTVGTAAHAFTLAHADERTAFANQVAAHGASTTLLVDTYDVAQGIRTAVEVAGLGLGAIRLDSGDLEVEARAARALLDELGAHRTKITVTSDLDEYVLSALADAPIDSYGVGTRLVTGSGHPTAGLVYKLVAIAAADAPDAPLRSVAKKSAGKPSAGGRKTAYRQLDAAGYAVAERIVVDNSGTDRPVPGRPLQVPVVRGGVVVHRPSLDEVRAHHEAALAELPAQALSVADGPPALVATQ